MSGELKARALTKIDLSDPKTLQWVQSQWDLLVTTNDWLRSREQFLLEQIRELKRQNSSLQRRLEQQLPTIGG